jgi:hypothetical protein
VLVRVNYLGHHETVDVGPFLGNICAQADERRINQRHLMVTLDWVQYKNNFRSPAEPRLFLDGSGPAPERELAVDVRRLSEAVADGVLEGALAQLYGEAEPEDGRLPLEEFQRPAESIIWSFNRAFWAHLSTWEAAFDRGFLSALPGGVSDGTNPDFWRDRLTQFLDVLDDLQSRNLVPEEIYVLELGVGNGAQAKTWLDTFRALCAERSRDYYQRVRYLMTDYSHDVLNTARATVAEHGDKVSCLNVDVRDPMHALSFLRYKVLFIHSCNLYDNLPTDEVARRNGRLYEVQVRAYVPEADVPRLCNAYALQKEDLLTTVQRFLRIGPEYFEDVAQGVRFWADLWNALRLEERYVLIEDPGRLRLGHGVPLDLVEQVLGDTPGDLRMHLSTGVIQSFTNTLPLLHPRGLFQVQDLFTTDLEQYEGTFRGPGKMDGSIVNWVNGPLLREVGAHLGYAVDFEPFRYRARSNIVVLTTSQKE